MQLTREQLIRTGFLILCCLLLIGCSIAVLTHKEAFFLDEYSSYGCANGVGSKNMRFENGVTYTPEEIEQQALAAYATTEGKQFKFRNVWRNLSSNVHPPVFYVLLHFVCSLTPGVFSMWQAAAVNILLGLLKCCHLQQNDIQHQLSLILS